MNVKSNHRAYAHITFENKNRGEYYRVQGTDEAEAEAFEHLSNIVLTHAFVKR
ncbi:hypothetical protein SDC9_102038 [bioreactor metagenome]|uniref:Uncharacterized protein n=1 Tax=bioreactor metagenome TaxID=1076179 RepID=A0A645APQ7_9ZZZZ